MKKTILILATILLSYSCSKDKEEYDPRNDLSYINFQNERFKGIWYFDKVIKTDGTIVDYIHFCPNNKDYVDFQSFKIKDLYHYNVNNCLENNIRISCQNYNIQGYKISICDDFVNGTYSLTNNKLKVEYDEVEYFGYSENNLESAKGLIFSRN